MISRIIDLAAPINGAKCKDSRKTCICEKKERKFYRCVCNNGLEGTIHDIKNEREVQEKLDLDDTFQIKYLRDWSRLKKIAKVGMKTIPAISGVTLPDDIIEVVEYF